MRLRPNTSLRSRMLLQLIWSKTCSLCDYSQHSCTNYLIRLFTPRCLTLSFVFFFCQSISFSFFLDVCECVRVSIYICVCIYMYICVLICVYKYEYRSVCVYVYVFSKPLRITLLHLSINFTISKHVFISSKTK